MGRQDDAAVTCAAYRVTENGQTWYFTTSPGEELMDADEKLFQQMWKTYFKSIAIKERLNPKLHRQHMPARFWKYMPEKL